MNGYIKFCNTNEGWGKIDVEGQSRDVYFNLRNCIGEINFLVNFDCYKDEPVTFEIADSQRRAGEKEGINIKLDLTKRRVGFVKSYDQERGIGNVEDFYTKEKIFFHYSAILKKQADKFERIELDEPVVFSIGSNDRGKCAVDILKIDKRYFIEEFAEFKDLRQSLINLKQLAEPENWDYLKNPTRGVPVLFSYANQTCKRVVTQNKVVKGRSSRDNREYAYFNTGLVTPQQDEIFAFFAKNENFTPLTGWGVQIPEWKFIEFNTEQSVYRRYFVTVPEIATYFTEAEIADLIFDIRTPIIPDRDHLLKRKGRIASDRIKNLDDEAFIEEIRDAIELAKKRIKRNYKTAIPHFYDERIQFLLPLCFRANKAEALGALVVNKNENIYEAHTILSLDQAYNNARLLAKPDREWLNP